jgi:hypothetical protein
MDLRDMAQVETAVVMGLREGATKTSKLKRSLIKQEKIVQPESR